MTAEYLLKKGISTAEIFYSLATYGLIILYFFINTTSRP